MAKTKGPKAPDPHFDYYLLADGWYRDEEGGKVHKKTDTWSRKSPVMEGLEEENFRRQLEEFRVPRAVRRRMRA